METSASTKPEVGREARTDPAPERDASGSASARLVQKFGLLKDAGGGASEGSSHEHNLAAETQARLELALAATRLGEWTWNAVTDRVTLSPRAAELLGIVADAKLTRASLRERIAPDDRAKVAEVMAEARDFRCEYRVQLPDGRRAWIAENGRGQYSADGTLRGIIAVVQEIASPREAAGGATDEARANRPAAVAPAETYGDLVNLLPAAIYTVDHAGRITHYNDAAAELWGRRPAVGVEQWCGSIRTYSSDGALVPPDHSSLATALRENRPVSASEIVIERPDGTRRNVLPHPRPLHDRMGRLIGALNMLVDVTELKRTELSLRESEARLRLATQSGKIGIWDWDVAADRITWTDSLYEIHGVKRDQFDGTARGFSTLLHPDDRGPVQRALQSSLEHDVPYELEFRAVRGNGAVVWLFANAVVVRENGRAVRMLGATFDITARKHAELALRDSEIRFRALASHAPVGIFLTDTNGDSTFVNESWCALAGLGVDQVRGKGWMKALHPEDCATVVNDWYVAVQERRPYHGEHRFQRPDGTVRWVQTSALEFRNAGGPLRGYIGTVMDITERKITEHALRESEKRFRTLASHAPVGIFLTDRQGETIFVNESWCAMAGLTPEAAKGRGWSRAMHPDDRARVAAEWTAALAENRSSLAEYRFVRDDGTVTWVQGNAVQLRDDAGRVVGYIGTVADFTARKAAEERLRAREAQLRLITTNAPIILAHCDREERYLFVNRAYTERFHREPEDVIGRTILDVLGPVAHQGLSPHIRRVLAGESVTFEIEIPYPDLGTRFMRSAYTPDFAEDGSVRGFLCAISDLTERRTTEIALRDSEARFRQLADSMPQIVFAADATGRTDYYNRRWYEFTGVEPGVFGDASFLPVLHPEDRRRCVDTWYQSVRSGELYQIEYRFRTREGGDYRWHLGRALPVRDASGNIVRWFGTCTDIHDWKLVQDELRRRTVSLETLNRVGSQLAEERDLEKVVQSVTDAGRELSGAAFGAFFYNLKNEAGETYTLYTLSGAPRAAFENFPMPRATKLFGPTFRGEGVLRIADVLQDERYGRAAPYHGMPPGHLPVRSYLAVPVISRSGEVLGGLFFGHPEPDRFNADAERTVSGLAAQAAIAIDNSNLYRALERELREKTAAEEELRRAKEQLQQHASELEQRVAERTSSLREAIVQMEEFSYSVSHDLRAPLRAMNAYAQALAEDYGPQLDETARNYLDRIQRSSVRMEKLTHDVLNYSRVARAEIEVKTLDLEVLLQDIMMQYAELQRPAAEVKIVAPLASVRGHETSLGQCLANLLTNAAKFVAPGVTPRICVRTEVVDERVRLWIEDNGIGISPDYQARLFRVFERVPTRHEYAGTGIGLAIVRKAVEKMGGTCGVVSDGTRGSRFWIELPKA